MPVARMTCDPQLKTRSTPWRAVGIHLGVAILTLLTLAVVLKLWRANFAVPFGYEWRDMREAGRVPDRIGSGDMLLFAAMIKGAQDNGWFLHNTFLGMPSGLDLYDYPFTDNLHFLLIKLLLLSGASFGAVYNSYFILTFLLTSAFTLATLRALRLSWSLSVTGALIYTFLPYHFLRGEQHIFLSSYYFVPLTSLVIIWLAEGEELLESKSELTRFAALTRRGWMSAGICVLTSATGVYYTMFAGFLALVATLIAARSKAGRRPLLAGVLVLACLSLSFLVNVSPTIIYQIGHGPNAEATVRLSAEAEIHGLKIVQLLLPICQHRLHFLSDLSVRYAKNAPLVAENATACLGVFCSAGFLLLLAWVCGFRWNSDRRRTMSNLGVLNMSGVLLATVGGFGSVFAFTVSPILRCYNRMSIYIAFFSLLAILFTLEKWFDSSIALKKWRLLRTLGLSALVLTALGDQTSEVFEPLYAEGERAFQRDADFVARVEASLPAGAMVFQFPYLPFPGSLPEHDYELMRGYLHSKTLRWSYASMKGRSTDSWMRNDVFKDGDVRRILQSLIAAGFKGIYIDRIYFANDDSTEHLFRQMVDSEPITSNDGRLLFFDFSKRPPPPP